MLLVVFFLAIISVFLSIFAIATTRETKDFVFKNKEKLDELDIDKISEKVAREINNLRRTSFYIEEKLRDVIQKEMEDFNKRLEKNKTEIKTLKEKLNNLRSRIEKA